MNRAHPNRPLTWLLLAAVLAASAALHAWLLLTTTGAWWDMAAYREHAYAALHGLNVYAYTPRYPYFPVWIWIAREMGQLSQAGVPFGIAIKLPGTIGDLLITFALFRHERARLSSTPRALIVPAMWALNPVSALLAAGHGQWDSLPLLFMLGAVLLVVHSREHPERRYLAALALGVAIALKAYAILLVPYLVYTSPRGRRLATAAGVAAPVLLSMAVYTLAAGFNPGMITHVVGYTSAGDIGLAALLRFGRVELSVPMIFVVYLLTANLLTAWVLTLARLFRSRPELAAAAAFAAFYVLVPRGSVQYIVAGLPFVLLVSGPLALGYSAAASALLVGFYGVAFPGALPSDLPVRGFSGGVWLYMAGLIGLVLVNAALLLHAWRLRDHGQADEPRRLRLRLPTPELSRVRA